MESRSIVIDIQPSVVSIGPYYHGKRHLKKMQIYKRRALCHFIDRTNEPIESYSSKLIKLVDQFKASYKYLDWTAWQDNDDRFVEMMMLDGCFILEFLDIADKFPHYHGDPMFSYHTFVLNHDQVMQDLLMEKNQLPYMVLETLWSIGFPDKEEHGFLSKMMSVNNPDPCFHALDYMKGAVEQYALEGKLRICCASELYQSGARFVEAAVSFIGFISETGILKLPRINFNRSHKTIYSNIIKYEKTEEPSRKFSAYMGLLGSLIQSSEDVRVLTSLGILVYSVGREEELVLTIKHLTRHIRLNPEDCLMSCSMLQQMHLFCETSANKWCTRFRFGRYDIQMKHYINHLAFFVMVALVYTVVVAGSPGLMLVVLLLMFLYVVYVKII